MASDLQVKTTQFNSLAFDIRIGNKEFFRGKTLSKMFRITTDEHNKPAIIFPKDNLSEDIKESLKSAFKSVFV